MKAKIFYILICSLICISKVIAQNDIQALLQTYVNEQGGVGVSAALIDHGEVQFFSYGTLSIHGTQNITEETLFEIGSITKVFTAIALLEMALKGELNLDDPIQNYLSEVSIPQFNGHQITLRHLATHTSGLQRLPDNLLPISDAKDYTVEELYNYLNHYSLSIPPGETFEYSHIGMGLLGHLLCLKSGMTYEKMIQEKITQPLGMTSTYVTVPSEMIHCFAEGHHEKQQVPHWNIIALAGAGGLRSNVKDMSKFLAANMNLGIWDECQTTQHRVKHYFEIGLGWLISKLNDKTIIWHNGMTGGFKSFLGFDAKRKKGIVILTNSTENWLDKLGFKILNEE